MNDLVGLSLSRLKAQLMIEHDDDDAYIAGLIQEVLARCQGHLDRALFSEEWTEYFDGGGRTLLVRNMPVDGSSVTVTDTHGTVSTDDDEVVASDYYRIYPERGSLWRTTSTGQPSRWPSGLRRFKVVYTGGLDLHPRWQEFYQRNLVASFADFGAALYNAPDPNVKEERDVDLSRKLCADVPIPVRVLSVWDQLKYA